MQQAFHVGDGPLEIAGGKNHAHTQTAKFHFLVSFIFQGVIGDIYSSSL